MRSKLKKKVNHLSCIEWSVEKEAGGGVGEGKVPDEEVLEIRLVVQHTRQREVCSQNTTPAQRTQSSQITTSFTCVIFHY